jgi:translation initiation factor RLI1
MSSTEQQHHFPNWLEAARYVVAHHQYVEYAGITLDAQTAQLLTQVHDGLTHESQQKMEAMSLRRASNIVWSMVARQKEQQHG